MRFRVTVNGVLCTKCAKQEMVYYIKHGAEVGHYYCTQCDNLVPVTREGYRKLDEARMDMFDNQTLGDEEYYNQTKTVNAH